MELTLRPGANQNLDYIIRRIFRDLLPLGYNLEVKSVKNFQDVLKDDFLTFYAVEKAA